ncbi:MAG: folylpolyglutamate synthase/dihydrofolate synthase family protein [Marinagarivorans sp.]|nr:folylpolyglutamate synthase/dihydrofolate synthase family protein [Marinagarivorans sp.]
MYPPFATLAEWLAWQESHHPSAIDLGLDRVRTVAERLGVLQPKAQVITIAGTNGKGSCVAALEALLAASHQRFGAYTSPHFLHYNERIRLQGEAVGDALLIDAFERIYHACEGISLTYFEYGTLAAMVIFNDRTLDFWVLEVGLGGRLDAVNIIAPDVAVITSIAIDHEAWLGNNREDIGREKAGICRAGKPLICSDPNPPVSVIEHAKNLHCPSLWLGQDFKLLDDFGFSPSPALRQTLALGEHDTLDLAQIVLPRPSVVAALEVCALLNVLPPAESLPALLADIRLMGRMQIVQHGAQMVILDVAHNPAASTLLAQLLRERGLHKIIAVVAMMADKDLEGALQPLVPLVQQWHCVELEGNSRAAKSRYLAQLLTQRLQVPAAQVVAGQTVANTLTPLAITAMPGVLPVVVFGSFFTVTEALGVVATPAVDSVNSRKNRH